MAKQQVGLEAWARVMVGAALVLAAATGVASSFAGPALAVVSCGAAAVGLLVLATARPVDPPSAVQVEPPPPPPASAPPAVPETLVPLVVRDGLGSAGLTTTTERASPELYQAVLDQLGYGVAAVDSNGVMLVFNPAAVDILGTMHGVPLGRMVTGRLDGEDVSITHPKTREPMVLRVVSRPLEVLGTQGHVLVFKDVTKRKAAELALAASEARHVAMMRAAPDGVAIVDDLLDVLEANPALARLLRCKPPEVGAKLAGLRLDGGSLPLVELVGEEPLIERSTMIRHAFDGEINLEVSVVPILGKGARSLFATTVRDVSERVRAQRLKDEFISTVSHELRTPLTSVLGSLGLVLGGVAGELPAGAQPLVKMAESNSKRLLALVNDILDMQKLAAGKVELRLAELDLGNVVEEAVEANRAYGTRLSVELALEPVPAGVRVQGDRDRLLQVLANLLSNAAKYSPEGGTVEVVLTASPEGAKVSVSDSGQGIPEAFRHRVFEKFAQADDAHGGTGLGLPISHAILERHGGSIGFDTEEGVGTTFWFVLPVLP